MKLEFKSLQFLETLKRLKEKAQTSVISVSLQVPDELKWWVWLEYGTGIRGDYPTSGYTITPKDAPLLVFFDKALNHVRREESVFMPGIPAFHMITTIEDDIKATITEYVRKMLQSSDYDFSLLKNGILEELMPEIRDMIVASFEENLPNHEREYGRLSLTAAQTFADAVEIVDNTL